MLLASPAADGYIDPFKDDMGSFEIPLFSLHHLDTGKEYFGLKDLVRDTHSCCAEYECVFCIRASLMKKCLEAAGNLGLLVILWVHARWSLSAPAAAALVRSGEAQGDGVA